MKKYEVTIEFLNGRENHLICWANDEAGAIKFACRGWGNPTIYKNLYARILEY